jgi:hypothetical protein
VDSHRQLGIYAGRIIAGAKPAGLPVEQSTELDLFINLKTARELDVIVLQTLLVLADRSIMSLLVWWSLTANASIVVALKEGSITKASDIG